MMNKNLGFIFMFLTLMGCEGSSDISVYEKQKDTQVYARSSQNNFFTWQAPNSWTFHKMIQPFQDALFFAPHISDPYLENDHTTAQISVSFIEGVEFDKDANIQRWKKQLASDVTAVNVNIAEITTSLGRWDFIKMTTRSEGLFVAVHESFDGTLFVKMQGANETLSQEAENFIQFIESVQEKDV